MRPIAPSPAGEQKTSASTSSPPPQRTPWHSPVPYLFGGLAAMLGLIAFALLILACSYWKLSGQTEERENERTDLERENEETGEIISNDGVKLYEEKILVIMAGDQNPTFLATPVCAKVSCFSNGVVSSKFENTEKETADSDVKVKEVSQLDEEEDA